jgi:hypothetical protein
MFLFVLDITIRDILIPSPPHRIASHRQTAVSSSAQYLFYHLTLTRLHPKLSGYAAKSSSVTSHDVEDDILYRLRTGHRQSLRQGRADTLL